MTVKIIHTSDWHLGKKLFKHSRLEEQQFFLNHLKKTLKENNCEFLIIPGDIFDTPYPPSEAIKIYLRFLYEVAQEIKVKIFIINGNHDSGRFLETQRPFFETMGIEVRGHLDIQSVDELIINATSRNGTKLSFNLLPYFRTSDLLKLGQNLFPEVNKAEDNTGHHDAILETLDKLLSKMSDHSEGVKILLAHHLFAGFEATGSEQGLSLSGVEQLPLSLVRGRFDYVALGHIHKYKTIQKSNPAIVYCGSPIPMRFSEKETKNIVLLDVKETGLINYNPLPLPQLANLIYLECTDLNLTEELDRIINEYQDQGPCYLYASISFKDSVSGTAEKIKEKIKDTSITLMGMQTAINGNSNSHRNTHQKSKYLMTPEELFTEFYAIKHPDSERIPTQLLKDFNQELNEYLDEVREVEGKGERI